MSRTLYIEYGGVGFWAYDVASGVFLKHLIERTSLHIERQPCAWLSDCIERWRVNAVVSDFGVHLDPEWTAEQRSLVRSLVDEACHELEKSEAISAEEAASWKILDGQGVFARGATQIPTAPSVELGRAIALLLEGQLPPAPSGTWWYYGVENGVSTIRKKA
jgi:hypothetical protein